MTEIIKITVTYYQKTWAHCSLDVSMVEEKTFHTYNEAIEYMSDKYIWYDPDRYLFTVKMEEE